MRCRKFKTVYSPVFRKRVRRCAKFGAGKPRSASPYRRRKRKGGYKRGHAPHNRGRKCVQMGTVSSPFFRKRVRRCLSWGGGKAGRKPGLFSRTPDGGYIPQPGAGAPRPSFWERPVPGTTSTASRFF